MIRAETLKRRIILSGFLGAVSTAFLLICLAGFGRISPEPTLGVIGFLCGGITLVISTWRWARRNR